MSIQSLTALVEVFQRELSRRSYACNEATDTAQSVKDAVVAISYDLRAALASLSALDALLGVAEGDGATEACAHLHEARARVAGLSGGEGAERLARLLVDYIAISQVAKRRSEEIDRLRDKAATLEDRIDTLETALNDDERQANLTEAAERFQAQLEAYLPAARSTWTNREWDLWRGLEGIQNVAEGDGT